MRVDAEVLEAFKATGSGWQTLVNALLHEGVKHGLVKPRVVSVSPQLTLCFIAEKLPGMPKSH
jgi:hypothetical protein